MAGLHRIVRALALIVPEQQADARFKRGHVPPEHRQIEDCRHQRNELGVECRAAHQIA